MSLQLMQCAVAVMSFHVHVGAFIVTIIAVLPSSRSRGALLCRVAACDYRGIAGLHRQDSQPDLRALNARGSQQFVGRSERHRANMGPFRLLQEVHERLPMESAHSSTRRPYFRELRSKRTANEAA
jgi:hypothetical protein